jgi:hypothetical protein
MTIIVNGLPVPTVEKTLSYEDVVKLAGETGNPSMTYRTPKVGDSRREGILSAGNVVVLESGMVFNVQHTDNA